MFNKLLEKIFYSKLFRNIRSKYYNEQGKFDAETDRWLADLEDAYMNQTVIIE